jgi:hypothetical protein
VAHADQVTLNTSLDLGKPVCEKRTPNRFYPMSALIRRTRAAGIRT